MQTLLSSIGNTPLILTQNLVENPNVNLWVKLEGNNPGGSVKDRAAFNMIKEAIDRGVVKTGDTLVEATSGNTGIALALIASQMGLNMKLVMPEDATAERVKVMKAFGAEVILTPAADGMEGARIHAQKLEKEEGYLLLNQFASPDNWKAHFYGTGPEIWKQTNGAITHFVSAMGTTGTIMGVSKFLKSVNPHIEIIGVQPKDGAKIPGIRKWEKEFMPEIFSPKKIDKLVDVSEEESRHFTKQLALKEGVFGGMSAGGAIAAAIEVANDLDMGDIVAIVPDRGDKYLSTDLFG